MELHDEAAAPCPCFVARISATHDLNIYGGRFLTAQSSRTFFLADVSEHGVCGVCIGGTQVDGRRQPVQREPYNPYSWCSRNCIRSVLSMPRTLFALQLSALKRTSITPTSSKINHDPEKQAQVSAEEDHRLSANRRRLQELRTRRLHDKVCNVRLQSRMNSSKGGSGAWLLFWCVGWQ